MAVVFPNIYSIGAVCNGGQLISWGSESWITPSEQQTF